MRTRTVPGTFVRQMRWDLERAYGEHLTSGDLAVLADLSGGRLLPDVLASAPLEGVVFGHGQAFDPLRTVSPFLTFAVAVHRTAERLAGASYVEEWIGPRQRVPVFAVEPLRQLLADPLRRFYFVELLSSYTHVVSGTTWTPTRRGWQRRRFSELDAVQMADLLDAVPVAELAGVLRRLGDLALFLTGVFPDHTATTPLGRASAEARLLRSAGVDPSRVPAGSVDPFQLLERLGARWYSLAVQRSAAPSASVQVLESIAAHFTDARRILNVVTDVYLFPLREQWFGRPAA
jgi:hypothetical protein